MAHSYAPWHLRTFKQKKLARDEGGDGKGSSQAFNLPHVGPSFDPCKSSNLTQKAVEIFHGDKSAKECKGLVDGVEVTFELLQNVTKGRPRTSREERQKVNTTNFILCQSQGWMENTSIKLLMLLAK